MTGQKKFGAFSGVFTPSILTILGVIMYMRMGWVVGNAGLIGTLIIVVIAHVISIATGLSLSSIATDKKVGAGGIYYILSRSMGIPIGGAIGITLYIGTAFSIALYLIGFAESFNSYFGFDIGINGLRIAGTIALIILTIIALISTSVALKTQFFILLAIVISLISIFFGSNEFVPQTVALFSDDKSVPLEVVFAIFFPAVTGFTAGIAMSGDLKDPKKSIPLGTIAAIATGFFVYIGLTFFLAYYIDSETLRSDYNILMKIALFAPVVVAGIWGATLSSALGGILGGPRILQAMSIDKITPRLFGKGKGKNNEPVNALILVFIIAQAGILIGELDVIARVVSMFYLAAYGFINLSFFLESWANPDFQPTFKVNRWFGLLGFLASFGIMFKLDMMAMFGAIVVIIGIYFLLQRKQIKLDSGDVWQSVWENIVAKGLKKLDASELDTSTNWNPNIILFSGESSHRPYLLELSKTLSGRTGIVTNFKLILDKENRKPLKKSEQIVKENSFEDLGIFARQVRVNNIYTGIENIASTFGFSGVEPNTIMMGWPKELSNSKSYAKMTETLLHLDYNLLYLDFDQKAKFGKYQTVDVWWRETDSKNAEMMLSIVRFILQSAEWNKARIRVLFVNHNNIDSNIIKTKISRLVEELRVNVEIVVINNGVEQRPFYDIIALQSTDTDLTLVGIPNVKTEKQATFILNTNQLFKSIGSTLLVKASNNFNELQLDLSETFGISNKKHTQLKKLPASDASRINTIVGELDTFLSESTGKLTRPALESITSFYVHFIDTITTEFDKTLLNLEKKQTQSSMIREVHKFINEAIQLSEIFKKEQLHSLEKVLDKGLNKLLNNRNEYLNKAPKNIDFNLPNIKRIKWKRILDYYFSARILPNTRDALYDFGVNSFMLPIKFSKTLNNETQLFIESINANNQHALNTYKQNISNLFKDLMDTANDLEHQTSQSLRIFERDVCIELIEGIERPAFIKRLKNVSAKFDKKKINPIQNDLIGYAKDWHRNQLLAHKQAEAGLYLTNSGLSLTTINETIKKHTDISYIYPQQRKLEILSNAEKVIRENILKKEQKHTKNNDVDEIAEGFTPISLKNLLAREEGNVLSLSNAIPNSVELMSPASFNLFSKSQTKFVDTLKINLSSVQNHIIQDIYLSRLQESLQKFETAYNTNSESIYKLANRINHLIDKSNDDHEFDTILDKVHDKLIANITKLSNLKDSLRLDLETDLHQTIYTLTIRTILDSEKLLLRASRKPIKQNKLKEWFVDKNDLLKENYQQIRDFIIQRKQDIDAIKFDEKHHEYANIIEQTSNLISALSIDPDLKKSLPFYYKRLFTGSHTANTNTLRKNDLDTIKRTLNKIDSGISGAIMIIGKAQSGKSFYTEAAAKIPENVVRYSIRPPLKQSFTTNDLHLGFQQALSLKGTSSFILNNLTKKSVFIFDDLEKWWIKSEGGDALINYLTKLIENYGDQHYFILNMNIHSYPIIKQRTALEKQLLTTIIVRPVDKIALKEIIINRHRIGGAEIWIDDELVGNSNKVDSIVNAIHSISQGTIGVALNKWLSSISINDEKQLILTHPEDRAFPKVNNPYWKLVLYHFVILKYLHLNQLKKIFKEDASHVLETLKEMEKAGLVYQTGNAAYSIHENLMYYIEEELIRLNILN